MIAVSTSPVNISMLRKFNTWYSIADGNWSDPTIWISSGIKKHSFPQKGDNVYIINTVLIDFNYTVNNCYVSGKLTFGQTGGPPTFIITGDLQATGIVDLSSSTDYPTTIVLGGVNNYIKTFVPASGTVWYNRWGTQDIMDLPYKNLTISGSGNKNVNTSLTVSGATNISDDVVLLNKYASSKLTFVGLLSGSPNKAIIDNTVNADIEFRGGIELDVRGISILLGSGNLYWNGDQTVHIGGGSLYNNYNTMIIKSNYTLTIAADNTPFVINGSIDGETSNSTFNVSGCIYQPTGIEPMATNGIYNHNFGGTSRIGYTYNGNYTLPYTSYNGLVILGSGIKTLSNATILTDTLIIDQGGTLELSSYDFTVGTTVAMGYEAALTKNDASGLTLFNGLFDGGFANTASLQFNAASITEFRAGMQWDIRGLTFTAVTGSTLKYTTNDQYINIGGGRSLLIGADILISGPITVTNQNQGFGTTGTLNGDNASSTFLNLELMNYQNPQQPMQTGILNNTTNTTRNIFEYNSNDNQDITPGTYSNLTLSGGGTKRLLGDVSVTNIYTLTSPATLDTNGFTLTNP